MGGVVPTERTGRTPCEVVEVYRTERCEGCGGLLAFPHVLIAHMPCSCAVNGASGHRTLTCRGCGMVHYEPPCASRGG